MICVVFGRLGERTACTSAPKRRRATWNGLKAIRHPRLSLRAYRLAGACHAADFVAPWTLQNLSREALCWAGRPRSAAAQVGSRTHNCLDQSLPPVVRHVVQTLADAHESQRRGVLNLRSPGVLLSTTSASPNPTSQRPSWLYHAHRRSASACAPIWSGRIRL